MSPKWWPPQETIFHPEVSDPDQEPFSQPSAPGPSPPQCIEPGWIHTYAPIRNLQLLYIDGTSSGNSECGTQDSQDSVLLRNKSRTYDPNDPLAELWRARGLCELAQNEFEGRIDGFIRMEHGFEVILCDFSLLEIVSILRSTKRASLPGPSGSGVVDEFFFLRAIVARYSGIGGHRVRIDYENFVTAFNHPEIDLSLDGKEQPRLNKISKVAASVLFNEVKQMILSDPTPVEERTDWQAVADMYVDRYARPIQNMISSTFDTAKALHDEMHRMFQPYLDETLTDQGAIIKRCQEAYIPTHLIGNLSPSLSQQVIEQSMHQFCSVLFTILTHRDVLEVQQKNLRDLMNTTKWTAWKECQPACAIDEICFTAIWPLGTQQDHDKPSCLNATALRGKYGYWDTDVE